MVGFKFITSAKQKNRFLWLHNTLFVSYNKVQSGSRCLLDRKLHARSCGTVDPAAHKPDRRFSPKLDITSFQILLDRKLLQSTIQANVNGINNHRNASG